MFEFVLSRFSRFKVTARSAPSADLKVRSFMGDLEHSLSQTPEASLLVCSLASSQLNVGLLSLGALRLILHPMRFLYKSGILMILCCA